MKKEDIGQLISIPEKGRYLAILQMMRDIYRRNLQQYVRVRSGNSITRLGYSHRVFQHAAQNWFAHQAGFARWRMFGYANYFMDYDHFQSGAYGYSGYYNPYSLWGR
jgi:hypothetical protein